eukprot:gnl/MRDRNA2_/MRDRNA2_41945_c0_seq2.p1 gnl/MRDRNA2_/MRDRNA2_41945_c0~~gnl/MRDRNA2_/MRDRNA2_41945_c0_seq2.p1  ORF type:complete len:333 (-),score=34.97 gnl/MRDRNA2_/MRDRNA2_41945_c0_seq2:21-1019(-)
MVKSYNDKISWLGVLHSIIKQGSRNCIFVIIVLAFVSLAFFVMYFHFSSAGHSQTVQAAKQVNVQQIVHTPGIRSRDLCCYFRSRSSYPDSELIYVPEGPAGGLYMYIWAGNDEVSGNIRNTFSSPQPFQEYLLLALLMAIKELAPSQWARGSLGIIDAGANLGWFSMVAALHGAHVLSIEAWDRNLYLFNQTIRANEPKLNGISLAQRAVSAPNPSGYGDTEALGCIKATPPSNPGNGKIPQSNVILPEVDKGCDDHPIFGTIDEILEASGLWRTRAIVAMNLDVNGFETQGILGASGLLQDPARKPCVVFVKHFRDWFTLPERGTYDQGI